MKFLTLLFCVSLMAISCNKTDENPKNDCIQIMKVGQDTNPNNAYSIFVHSLDINSGCLEMELGFSGCDANHEIDLLTQGSFAESNPPQLLLFFKDHNEQDCDAYFKEDFSFDLELVDELLGDEASVYLTFYNSDKRILYTK